MLKIIFQAETENDTFSPIAISNGIIENLTEERRGEYDIKKAHRQHLTQLEEVARHILVYVEAQKEMMK